MVQGPCFLAQKTCLHAATIINDLLKKPTHTREAFMRAFAQVDKLLKDFFSCLDDVYNAVVEAKGSEFENPKEISEHFKGLNFRQKIRFIKCLDDGNWAGKPKPPLKENGDTLKLKEFDDFTSGTRAFAQVDKILGLIKMYDDILNYSQTHLSKDLFNNQTYLHLPSNTLQHIPHFQISSFNHFLLRKILSKSMFGYRFSVIPRGSLEE